MSNDHVFFCKCQLLEIIWKPFFSSYFFCATMCFEFAEICCRGKWHIEFLPKSLQQPTPISFWETFLVHALFLCLALFRCFSIRWVCFLNTRSLYICLSTSTQMHYCGAFSMYMHLPLSFWSFWWLLFWALRNVYSLIYSTSKCDEAKRKRTKIVLYKLFWSFKHTFITARSRRTNTNKNHEQQNYDDKVHITDTHTQTFHVELRKGK